MKISLFWMSTAWEMLLMPANEKFDLLKGTVKNVNILSAYIYTLSPNLLICINVLFLTGFTEVNKISREISGQTP